MLICATARPREAERRIHNRVLKGNLALDVAIQFRQIPVINLDTEEPELENWPFILPTDFAGAPEPENIAV